MIYEIGQRIGRLTILDKTLIKSPVIGKRLVYKVKCDCGCEKYISSDTGIAIKNGSPSYVADKSTSCGCVKFDRTRKDLNGRRFGSLVVLGFDNEVKHFLCKCDCGKEFYADSWELTRDGIDSCEDCRAVGKC